MKKDKIEKIIIYCLNTIFILIVGILTVYSMFQTAYIKTDEFTEYAKDNIFIHIAIIVVILSIGLLLRIIKKQINKYIEKRNFDKKKFKKYANIVKSCFIVLIVIIWGAICIRWIYITKLYPRADQYFILQSAEQIKDGNYASLEKGGYLYIYPQQIGLTLIEYWLINIFHENTYIVMQIINVIALIISLSCIYLVTKQIDKGSNNARIATLFTIAFLPISFYITFVYGNLIGLACSMIAIVFELQYLKTEKRRYIPLMAIFIAIAVIVKSNYLINLIAMVLVLITNAVFRRKVKYTIPVIIIIICYLMSGRACNFVMGKITNIEINKGMPSIAWVAMGMQEGNMAQGWYNSYSKKTFIKYDYNIEKTSKKAKNDIKERLEEFKNNPKYALEFYEGKINSQWNNPTFQGFWINNDRKSFAEENKVVNNILNEGTINNIILKYMNYYQTVVLVGALGYVIVKFKKLKIEHLTLAIIFIGGFIFHLIWEAKCQYAITYFVLLIPYTIIGYHEIMKKIEEKYIIKKGSNNCGKQKSN